MIKTRTYLTLLPLWLHKPLGLAVQILGTVVQIGVITGITGILRVGFVRVKRDLVGLVSIHVLAGIAWIAWIAWIAARIWAQLFGCLPIVRGGSRNTHGVRSA